MARGASSTKWRFTRIAKLLWRFKGALLGAFIVSCFTVTALAVSVTALLGISLTPYNPIAQNVGPALAPPSWSHLFGTDLIGRDVFSRVVAATPNDFFVCISVVAVAFVVGSVVGVYAGYHGGIVDEVLMRVTDVFFGIPALVLAMAIGFVLGVGVTNMVVALIVIWWPPYARLARGETLKVAHQNYIHAARLSGSSMLKILWQHAFRNIYHTMLIYSTLDVGTVLLLYSGLSYLGLSVRPPQPDWGKMISEYQDFIVIAPWLSLIPGLIISMSVFGFSMIGDGLRDIAKRL